MSTVEETVEEETAAYDDIADNVAGDVQQQPTPELSPSRKPANAKAATAAGGGGTPSVVSGSGSAGGKGGSSGGPPSGHERGWRATAGDVTNVRPVSPKRAVAVVRRQSVSKVGGAMMMILCFAVLLLFSLREIALFKAKIVRCGPLCGEVMRQSTQNAAGEDVFHTCHTHIAIQTMRRHLGRSPVVISANP